MLFEQDITSSVSWFSAKTYICVTVNTKMVLMCKQILKECLSINGCYVVILNRKSLNLGTWRA